MEPNDLILRLFQVVTHKLTHRHYNHVVNKATLYKQLVAGVGLDALLRQYVRRENSDLFNQRVRLTQHIVTSVSKNLLNIYYKIPRSNAARRVLTYAIDKEDSDKKTLEIEGVLSKFWGNESWDDYMATRYVELNSIDPNSFVVFEWDAPEDKTQLIQPRPFEVTSTAAVDYLYSNKVLQYLIVKDDHWFDEHPGRQIANTPPANSTAIQKPNHGKKKGRSYTLYGTNQTWSLLEVSEELLGNVPLEEGTIFTNIVQGTKRTFVKLGKSYFEFLEFEPHKIGKVPAFRVGYNRDLATDGETFVNPLHAIEPYLLKTITRNSHFDLVATLLAMPQQIRFGIKCEDKNCYKGINTSTNTECKTCGGTGVKATAPSVQDSIIIQMPDDPTEAMPLDDLIKYIGPPVDLVKWQEEHIDRLTDKCKTLMFNADIFSKKQVSDTATGKMLDMENVYDTLWPFAKTYGKTWNFGVKIIAHIIDRYEKLVASSTFGKDFKLKTLDTLIFDLTIAQGLNNSALVTHINRDIAEIIFAEKPVELQRYKLQEFYNPFNGKTSEEIAMLMSSSFVSLREKVLHANYSRIFDELELAYAMKGKSFYALSRSEQRKAIYDKVDEIIEAIAGETPEPVIPLD